MINKSKQAKKSLGQNFLTDTSILESIVQFAEVSPHILVLEIGPGRGALTRQLLNTGARVTALELDRDLLPLLEKQLGQDEHFSLVYGDILEVSLQEIVRQQPYQVVANIPYYITAPIIRKLLTEIPGPQKITLLVQKEVAERLAGSPKTRSVLTVATQFYSRVTLGPVIPKTDFDPVPKVDSQVVALVPYRKPCPNDKQFFRLVRAGFSARRKTLFNNITASRLLSKEELEKIFRELEWPLTRRAQDLEIAEWETLYEKVSEEVTT